MKTLKLTLNIKQRFSMFAYSFLALFSGKLLVNYEEKIPSKKDVKINVYKPPHISSKDMEEIKYSLKDIEAFEKILRK